jgi:hypothetical protein
MRNCNTHAYAMRNCNTHAYAMRNCNTHAYAMRNCNTRLTHPCFCLLASMTSSFTPPAAAHQSPSSLSQPSPSSPPLSSSTVPFSRRASSACTLLLLHTLYICNTMHRYAAQLVWSALQESDCNISTSSSASFHQDSVSAAVASLLVRFCHSNRKLVFASLLQMPN